MEEVVFGKIDKLLTVYDNFFLTNVSSQRKKHKRKSFIPLISSLFFNIVIIKINFFYLTLIFLSFNFFS